MILFHHSLGPNHINKSTLFVLPTTKSNFIWNIYFGIESFREIEIILLILTIHSHTVTFRVDSLCAHLNAGELEL